MYITTRLRCINQRVKLFNFQCYVNFIKKVCMKVRKNSGEFLSVPLTFFRFNDSMFR